ncbi:MAG: NAD-dependent epimerase/dehydratase family protein [Planctomycetes bacterium]|nr:NAD-dependent epimerase/dehydratase family protein [Planctomycetota bacterium]
MKLSDGTRVLVTGGAGFIGAHVVARLSERGARVRVVDDFSTGTEASIRGLAGVEALRVDVSEAARVRDAVESFRPQAAIHLAALHFIPLCNREPVRTVQVNALGTRNVLAALERHPPEAVFVASTAAVYPIGDGPHREEDEPGPTDVYGMTKLLVEDLAELYHRRTAVRTVVGRLFNVYGPGETNPHVVPELVAQLRRGATRVEVGNLEPKRDYVHVRDVARGILAVTERSPQPFRVYNLGTGREASVRELLDHFSAIVGTTVEPVPVAGRRRASDRPHLVADARRAAEEVGWRAEVELRAGLAELVRGEASP